MIDFYGIKMLKNIDESTDDIQNRLVRVTKIVGRRFGIQKPLPRIQRFLESENLKEKVFNGQ